MLRNMHCLALCYSLADEVFSCFTRQVAVTLSRGREPVEGLGVGNIQHQAIHVKERQSTLLTITCIYYTIYGTRT